MSGFKNKYGPWAVVTGASDGIGRDIARQLAARGLHLVLVSRREALLDALAAELRAAHRIETRVLAVDLTAPSAAAAILDATRSFDVGLLVAAAGFGTSGPFLRTGLASELEMLDVNCRSALALTHAFADRFVQRGRGGVVLLSSLLAFQGVPRAAHYAATKAYIQTLAEGLHHELRPLGVDVVASAPGPVRSGFAARANMRMGATTPPEQVAKGTLDALGRSLTVRPGALSKLLSYSLATLPRWGRTRILAAVMSGMTQHQDAETQPQTTRPPGSLRRTGPGDHR